MTPELQSIVALGVVALVAGWFVWRTLAKGRQPGCGGDCGCPSSEIKSVAAKLPRP